MVAGEGNDQPPRCRRLSPKQLAPGRATPKRAVPIRRRRETSWPGRSGGNSPSVLNCDSLGKRCELLGVKTHVLACTGREREHLTHRPAPPLAPLQPNARLRNHAPTYKSSSLPEMPLSPLGIAEGMCGGVWGGVRKDTPSPVHLTAQLCNSSRLQIGGFFFPSPPPFLRKHDFAMAVSHSP